jgi:hypothetical protein
VRTGLPVCIGGFHVSGSIAMPEMPREMREAARLGISFLPARPSTAGSIGWSATPGMAHFNRFTIL